MCGKRAPQEDSEWCTPCLDTLACSFCKRSRREVRRLVAGPDVHICDSCVALCVEVLDADGDRIAAAIRNLSSLVEAAALSSEDLAAAFEASVALARRRVELLPELVQTGFRMNRPDLALRAALAIPEEARDLRWHQQTCSAHYRCGNYRLAHEIIEAADSSEAAADDKLRHELNLLACELKTGDDRDAVALEETLSRLDLLREHASTLDDSEKWCGFVDEMRADCLLALGRPRVAERLLAPMAGDDATTPLSLSGRVLLGDCLHALGYEAGARSHWRAVQEAVPDEHSRAYQDAAERLARAQGPYR